MWGEQRLKVNPMETTELSPLTPVGRIAASAPLATRVFARHGIDFCCAGGTSLEEACSQRGLAADTLLSEIQAELAAAPAAPETWTDAPLDQLIDHIIDVYHRPLDEELPRIEGLARKVHRVHGERHPSLITVLSSYLLLKRELELHMRKEEEVLFPLIRSGRGEMAHMPVSVMESEHEEAGGHLRDLRKATDDYQLPDGACNTWRALWHALEDLERSLHEHIHLENNILFPRALKPRA